MSNQNDSSVGSLFRKVIEANDSERSAILASARPEVHAGVQQLLACDADAQEKGLLQSLQPATLGHGRFVPGTQITSRYRIVSLIGRGGMGEVYRADDLQIGESVALKFPSWDFTEDQQKAKRFYAEVRSARQVTHPSNCQVYDVGEFEGETFITMEYIAGEDLKSLIRRVGRLSHEKGIEIASQICAGLAAAHSKGVLHRDLKPANVMIDDKGHARITDFGLASLVENKPRGSVGSGTPAYMAPEQLLSGETSVQTDLYSLGLILFEIFTGQRAHPSGSLKELILLHQAESGPVRPSDVIDDIDPAVDLVIRRCLDSHPGARPDNAATVSAQLTVGNPLYVAQLADDVPSPELVATYGERGVLAPWIVALLTTVVCVGLGALLLLSDTSRLLNVAALIPPQVLQHEARQVIEKFGYSTDGIDGASQVDWASGFMGEELGAGRDTRPAFWYRQSPNPLIGIQIPLEAKPANYGTIVNLTDPPWTTPGMIALTFDPAAERVSGERNTGSRRSSQAALKWFRATPTNEKTQATEITPKVDWKAWFNTEMIGFDLSQLKSATWRTTPPDAFDQQAAWEGTLPSVDGAHTGQRIYVEAASFRGRPTFFHVMSEEEFNAQAASPAGGAANKTRTGAGLPVSNILTVLAIVFFARRNWRLRRCDRAGAAKIATFVLVGQMIGWICLTSHTLDTSEYFLVRDGLKSAIGSAFTAWVVYLALEPFVRKHVPHLLVSWSRLLDGRWTDPIVGRDVLVAVIIAVWVEVLLGVVQSLPGANRLDIAHMALAGWSGVIGSAIGGAANFVTWMLIIFTTCTVIYRYTGRGWLACTFIFLGIGLSAAARDGNLSLCYLYVAVAVMPAIATVRYGLLFLVAFAIFDCWLQQPITTDVNAFHFPTSVFWIVVFVTLAFGAAAISLGERRKRLLA